MAHNLKFKCDERLARAEAKLRSLPDHGRYGSCWAVIKAAIDCGYTDYARLDNYVSGIYLQQWGSVPDYVHNSCKHGLQEAQVPVKTDAVKIERSKALSSIKEKYAEFSPEFKAWLAKTQQSPLFPTDPSIENATLDDLRLKSAEAMRKIAGEIPADAYVYVGAGKWDFKGVEGRDDSRIGFWRSYDAPDDNEHQSWCPNFFTAPTRSKDTCREVRYLAMEMDRALVETDAKPGTAGQVDAIYEASQRYWQYILSLKCLNVRALVYSGGKSIHALVPVTCTMEEFAEKQTRIKAGYLKLYMDDSMVDCAKKTRRPWGVRKFAVAHDGRRIDWSEYAIAKRDAAKGDLRSELAVKQAQVDERNPLYIVQELLYLDESAEPMTLDQLCDGMKRIYSEYDPSAKDEVAEAEAKLDEPMPLVWVETEDEAGEKRGKWVWAGRNIDAFLANVGISQYNITSETVGLLKKDYTTHVISSISSKKAWSIVYEYVKERSPSMAAELRDSHSRKFTDTSLGIYVGNHVGRINKLLGTKDETYFPYRNGMLVVRKDGVELKPYSHETYYGEIWDDAPTLTRDWRQIDHAGCEFELFIRHMCGSELQDKTLASRRYDAVRAILGYEICACHEHTNWAVFLTDESLLNDDGGTGKSITLKSVKWMRRTWIRESEESKSEFDWSNVTRSLYNVCIDETKKDFDFRDFFSKTTGGWNISHKFVDGVDEIPEAETPLLFFATNHIPKGMGASHERRKKIYEVSMHYHGGITPATEFGHILFADWDDDEWARFDNFMVSCAQFYLAGGLKDPEASNTNLKTKTLLCNIPDEVNDFLVEQYITRANEGKKMPSNAICRQYKEWCDTNGRKNRDYATRTLNEFVQKFCNAKGIVDDFRKHTVKEWKDGREVEYRTMCHYFEFPADWQEDDTAPSPTGRTAHDPFLGV